MYIYKLITFNWANLPNGQELEFGKVNLVVGESGSGKTTLLDAIQAVMTAAYRGLFQFNPGQDEATQQGHKKIPRTLASYILGCDDGAYAREHCDGYVALVFVPNKGESAQPFSVILGARAHLEIVQNSKTAREDNLKFFLVLCAIEKSQFLQSNQPKEQLIKLEDMASHLKALFGRDKVESFSEKREYLARLYGLLSNSERAYNWMDAARSFSRFMAYKQIKDLNDFVRDEILDAHDMSDTIKKTSSMMQSLNQIESEAQHIQKSVELLTHAKNETAQYLEHWVEYNVLSYTRAKITSEKAQTQWLEKDNHRDDLLEKKISLERKSQQLEEQRHGLDEKRIQLEAKKQGNSQAVKIDTLKQDKAKLEQEVIRLSMELVQSIDALINNISYSKEVGLLLHDLMEEPLNRLEQLKSLKQHLDTMANIDAQWLSELRKLMTSDDFSRERLAPYLSKVKVIQQWCNPLVKAIASDNQKGLISVINRQVYQTRDELKQITDRHKALESEINRLQYHSQVKYPNPIENSIKAIRNSFPDSRVSVLCDHLEITDEAWQQAIEGYLANARYNIVVDDEHEGKAADLVRSLKINAKVIQGRLAKKDSQKIKSLDKNSIVHLLKFNHQTAEHFMRASYGGVQQVSSTEELRSVRRGITQHGLGSASYTMFGCLEDIDNLVLGKNARLRALAQKKAQASDIQEKQGKIESSVTQWDRLITCISNIKLVNLSELFDAYQQRQQDIKVIDHHLSSMNLEKYESLLVAIDGVKQQIDAIIQDSKQVDLETGAVDNRIDQLKMQLKQLNIQRDQALLQLEENEKNLHSIERIWPEFVVSLRIAGVDESITQAMDVVEQGIEKQQSFHEQQLYKNRERLRDVLTRYLEKPVNRQTIAHQLDESDYRSDQMFKEVVRINSQLRLLLEQLGDHILADKMDKMDKIRQEFDQTFISDLCQNVYQAVGEGKKRLKVRNQELKNLSFGTDQERYEFTSEWVCEYKEYYDFFQEVIDSETIFNSEQMTQASNAVGLKIKTMLLDPDQERAYLDLQRICDYRNYRSYDILKKVPGKDPIKLSRYGTGSGGQLETPSYVIRAAGLSGAMGFDKEVSFRTVLIDESFSKMDEVRSRRVIEYLTQNLDLQLLFVMPTRGAGPFEALVSHRFNVAKVSASQPMGELKTQVLIDSRVMKPDQVAELIETHRQQLKEQSELKWLDLLEDDDDEKQISLVR